jgi:hypothetical protein
MADERTNAPCNEASAVPAGSSWPTLIKRDGDELFDHYRHVLEKLGNENGLLGLIFNKSQNKFQDPAKLWRLMLDEKRKLKESTFRGCELVRSTARLCAMNMMLHGIGGDELPLVVADSLAGDPGDRYEIVMTNPPFGKKSSTTIVADDDKVARETEIIERDDF